MALSSIASNLRFMTDQTPFETTLMFREAAEASDVCGRQIAEDGGALAELAETLRRRDPLFVMTCARGSSDHAATFAKYLIERRLRIPVASLGPSTVSVYDAGPRDLSRAVFIAISQSGQSPDLLASARAARKAGAIVIGIVNNTSSPLADAANAVVPLLCGPERSVAATKSYLASLFAIVRLVSAWTGDADLSAAVSATPNALQRAWDCDWSAAAEPLLKARGLFTVSRGALLGIAQEAALKFKETSGLHAEAFSSAEVRHGPMAIVEDGFPVLMFVPRDAASAGFADLSERFSRRGAYVMSAGAALPGSVPLPFVEDLHPLVHGLAMTQSFYRFVNALAQMRGHDPDRPPALSKVTETR